MFSARLSVAVCLALALGTAAPPAGAVPVALEAADVPRLVAAARDGDVRAEQRLAAWLAAARAGEPGALAVAADVATAGVVADAGLVARARRHAAEHGYDARTGRLDAVVRGDARVTPAQAAALVARSAGAPTVDAAAAVVAPLNADVSQYVVTASFSEPVIDPEDVPVVTEVPADDGTAIATTNPRTTVCRGVEYFEPILGYVVTGLQVCTSWRYDGVRYVGGGSRTVTPYITLFGTARGWRWLGTNVAVAHYYNYKRRGPRSGYHTRTVGRFQRCVTQELVISMCDQERFPHIQIDGHYDGTYSATVTP